MVFELLRQQNGERVHAALVRLAATAALLALILTALGGGAILFFRCRLVTPMTTLTQVVGAMARGDRGVEVQYLNRPDLGGLARGLGQVQEHGRTADRLSVEQKIKASQAALLADLVGWFEAQFSCMAAGRTHEVTAHCRRERGRRQSRRRGGPGAGRVGGSRAAGRGAECGEDRLHL